MIGVGVYVMSVLTCSVAVLGHSMGMARGAARAVLWGARRALRGRSPIGRGDGASQGRTRRPPFWAQHP